MFLYNIISCFEKNWKLSPKRYWNNIFRSSIKNYLLLGNLVIVLGNIVQIFLRKANYNLNMLSMFIVYILDPLVIDIKNIFNIILSAETLTITETIFFVKFFYYKEVSELLWKTILSKNISRKIFSLFFSLVHTNSF